MACRIFRGIALWLMHMEDVSAGAGEAGVGTGMVFAPRERLVEDRSHF